MYLLLEHLINEYTLTYEENIPHIPLIGKRISLMAQRMVRCFLKDSFQYQVCRTFRQVVNMVSPVSRYRQILLQQKSGDAYHGYYAGEKRYHEEPGSESAVASVPA
jgi:hypothetical protein